MATNWYTTAEEAYDGFGTQTVEAGRYEAKGKSIRKVEIVDRHLDWQRARYASGLHLCVPESELPDLLGWFVTEVEAQTGT